LTLAVEGALWGAFGSAGQRCTATSRLLLHKDIHDEVVGRIVEQSKKLKLGDGLKDGIDIGPLVNPKQLARVLRYIELGKKEGATMLCGGTRSERPGCKDGHFVEPTVFTNVTRDMKIFREEIFGPVLCVVKVGSLEEAVDTLNDCAYGLSSSVYTQDINKALSAVRDIEAGIVYVNGPTIGAEVHLPFGGVKGSGNGHREAGRTGLDIFTEWKTVYVDYSGKLQRAQIDNS
jgi:alpha-ketoglutaric semialdehyde dehydrogenase